MFPRAAGRSAGDSGGDVSAVSRDSDQHRAGDECVRIGRELRGLDRWRNIGAGAFERDADGDQDSVWADRERRIYGDGGTDEGPGYRLQYVRVDCAGGEWNVPAEAGAARGRGEHDVDFDQRDGHGQRDGQGD